MINYKIRKLSIYFISSLPPPPLAVETELGGESVALHFTKRL